MNWNDFLEKKASFVKSSRMTAGGIDEVPPRNWYDRRVYDASTGHQNPVKAVNDEMHREWRRSEAEKKQRWEETKKKWSGAFRQLANTMSQTDASPGGGYENVAASIKLPQLPHYTLWDTEKGYQDRYHVSDPYFHNILVGGANAGGEGFKGMSYMPFGVLSKGPNREVFRNGQVDEIKAAIKASLERGEHPRVVGHSWGGSTVANLSKEYPNIPFIAEDPVSWTGTMDEYPDNLTVLFPNPGTDQDDTLFSKLAPIFGHRWAMPKKGRVIRYDGGHVAGLNEAIDRLNYREWAKRDPTSFLGYYDEEGNRRPDVPKGAVASGANGRPAPGGS